MVSHHASRYFNTFASPSEREDVTPAYLRYVEWCRKLNITPTTLHRYEATERSRELQRPTGWYD